MIDDGSSKEMLVGVYLQRVLYCTVQYSMASTTTTTPSRFSMSWARKVEVERTT